MRKNAGSAKSRSGVRFWLFWNFGEFVNGGTTERRNDGTTETEETQTAADKTGTAAETTEDQRGEKSILPLKKPLGTPANGVSSGRYFSE